MKVAILTAFNPYEIKGGIETFIVSLNKILTEHDIQTDLISLISNLPNKCNHMIAKSILPPFLYQCFLLGRQFQKIEANYDLVISNNFYGIGYIPKKTKAINIYHSTHAGYATAIKDKIPIREYRNLKYYFGHIGDRVSGYKKMKIAVSNSVREELMQYYGFKDIMVIPHGIDTEFYKRIPDTHFLRSKWGIDDNAFVGIFVGRWEIGKGVDILSEIIFTHPEIYWILVTGNTDCHLTGRNNIKIIKNADKHDLKELYSLSNFMLFPSYYEGFGLVILEAMACELPVICTEVGICSELKHIKEIEHILITVKNKNQIINEITTAISRIKNEDFSEKNGMILRQRVIEGYSIKNWMEKIIRLVENVY